MKRHFPAALCLAFLSLLSLLMLLPRAGADDLIVRDNGARYRGKIIDELHDSWVIETSAGKYRIPKSEVVKIVREGDLAGEFKKRWKKVDKYDPDKLYLLGVWSKEKGLEAEAARCFAKVLKIDSFHRKTREALGFRRWHGKWVTQEDYNKLARGLVKHRGRWVTKEERDLLEQGYQKDDSGAWMRPEDVMRKREWEAEARERRRQEAERRKEAEAARKAKRAGGKAKPKAPQAKPLGAPRPAGGPAGAPKRKEEDTGWYDDHSSTGSFATAPELSSRHYKIKTNIKGEYAKRYGKMLDQYFKRFSKVFSSFMPKGQIPQSPIYIYATQNEFMSATGMSRYTGGFYNTGTRRVTAYHGRFGSKGTTRTVIAHEGTHQFEHLVLGHGFGNAPIWIIEGLAVFFESAYYDPDKKKVEIALVPYDRLSNLKRGASSNTLISFHDLIRTAQPQFTAYHYAHAWGLIYYMLYGTTDKKIRKKRLKAFTDLLFLAKKQKVQAEDTEKVFGGRAKFQKFEEDWRKWVVQLPYDFNPKK